MDKMSVFRYMAFVAAMLISCNVLAQRKYTIKGNVCDKADSVALMNVKVDLMQGAKLIQSTVSDQEGNFAFSEKRRGKYKLKFRYLHFSELNANIKLPRDTSNTYLMSTVSSAHNDSIASKQDNYIMYFFGKPYYPESYLAEIGKPYGFKYKYLGCVVTNGHLKYNEMVGRILRIRNGDDWQERFWEEARAKYKPLD